MYVPHSLIMVKENIAVLMYLQMYLLGYWIGMLIYICYKACWYVAVCQFIL
jgi:hypothetical protein